MSTEKNIVLKPVGYVRTRAYKEELRSRKGISQIIISEEFVEALDGIQEFSHLLIVFWMHKVTEAQKHVSKVHPMGKLRLPLVGVFSTRTPFRPNPIGVTRVELLDVKGNVLTVKGLDAFDGTPVLDIKPFDYWNEVKDIRVPDWWAKLKKEWLAKSEKTTSSS